MNYDNYKLATPDETPFKYVCDRCEDGCSEVYEIVHFMPEQKGGDEIEMVCLECFEKYENIN